MSDVDPTLLDDIVDVRPYAGMSGWSGSETSRDAAFAADTVGVTSRRQSEILRYLTTRGATGATWREVANHFGWHHGIASGRLSELHQRDLIGRTSWGRLRCAVYVSKIVADGLPSEQLRPFTPNTQRGDAQAVAEALYAWTLSRVGDGTSGPQWDAVDRALRAWAAVMGRPPLPDGTK